MVHSMLAMEQQTSYLTHQEALMVYQSRQSLRAEVEKWWASLSLPPMPLTQQGPLALLARQVASARYEDLCFYALAKKSGLKPVWIEWLDDMFADTSSYKRSLVKRIVVRGRGRKGGLKADRDDFPVRTSDINGKRLRDIIHPETGESLPDFHHRLQDSIISDACRVDFTQWLNAAGRNAQERYPISLSLHVAHGVLFEDYHGGESGKKLNRFTSEVFEPAYEEVRARFGVAPMIVPLPWESDFRCYPIDGNWPSHGVVPSEIV